MEGKYANIIDAYINLGFYIPFVIIHQAIYTQTQKNLIQWFFERWIYNW